MTSFGSIAGLVLAIGYLGIATYVVQDELRRTGGGWINLRGLGTKLMTSPSEATFGTLLRTLGVRPVNFNEPGFAGYGELALHLLVTALVVYGVGWGAEWLFRRWF